MKNRTIDFYKQAGRLVYFPQYAVSALCNGNEGELTDEEDGLVIAFEEKMTKLGYSATAFAVVNRNIDDSGYHFCAEDEEWGVEFCTEPEFGKPCDCVKLFYPEI